MQPVNPYAAPQNPFADKPYIPQPQYPPVPYTGVWRQGKLLVMHRDAPLPDRCVKSNQPTKGRTLKRSLSWHHPAFFLVALLNVLLYIIVAMAMRKQATIYIGLSEEWFAIRRRRMIIAWSLVLAAVGLAVTGIALAEKFEAAPALILIGLALGLGAAIYGVIAARLVYPKKMTVEHIWLKGVCREYLDQLPELPA